MDLNYYFNKSVRVGTSKWLCCLLSNSEFGLLLWSDLRSLLVAVVVLGLCWCWPHWARHTRRPGVSPEMFLYVEERQGDGHLQGRNLLRDPPSDQHQHPGESLPLPSLWQIFPHSIPGSGPDQQCSISPSQGRLLLPGPGSPAGHFPLSLQPSPTEQILPEEPDQPGKTQPQQQPPDLHPQPRLQCRHRVEVRTKLVIKTCSFDFK